ncbi:hypothetical protein Q5424_05025 [Conexibacter sp. JD483]|uniref:hypothetical protein n=1 Tax=unclassified Conexibacter TaxID=2627773 RepID=UPI0027161F21|nr:MULTISPECIES: hypothetical protein [unclassified Conexibacter]MDO8184696.1 hypothetical protein [Conexibacter sp. CPCC 205706]MDO8198002.1 hypothetical protein [Conexibacter sp. CPCC 205762]MDR9368432.1 hypothetical protein [Conexibacter sp. JD483]
MSYFDLTARLAAAFEEERDLSSDPVAIARAVAARRDVVSDVAQVWLAEGIWPEYPEIEGLTPRRLARFYEPSATLLMLAEMLDAPLAAQQRLATRMEYEPASESPDAVWVIDHHFTHTVEDAWRQRNEADGRSPWTRRRGEAERAAVASIQRRVRRQRWISEAALALAAVTATVSFILVLSRSGDVASQATVVAAVLLLILIMVIRVR